MASWAETAAAPKFLWVIDWRSSVAFFIWLLHMRMWTLYLAAGTMLLFGALAWFGLTLPVLWRRIRAWLAGRTRAARPWWYWKRFTCHYF